LLITKYFVMNFTDEEIKRKRIIKKKHQASFRRFLKGKSVAYPVREYIGMNMVELKTILEARMRPSMSWQNYGTHWVIDHVAPFWIFDMEDEKDLKLLWHPDNLMPMKRRHNLIKESSLHWSILKLRLRRGYSYTIERLIERCQLGIGQLDEYLTEY
jgi:hypothetical protein